MKDKMLKLAGVKTEAAFYKKFPTEAAFMKVHGKAYKKAAMGTSMVNTQLHQLSDFGNPPIAQNGVAFGDLLANANATNSGMSRGQYDQKLKQETANKTAMDAAKATGGGFSNALSSMIGKGKAAPTDPADVKNHLGGLGIDDTMPTDRNGGYHLMKAQGGGAFDINNIAGFIGGATQGQGGLGSTAANLIGGKGTADSIMGNAGKSFGGSAGAAGLGILNAAPQILQGIGQMKEQKKNIQGAEQAADVSGLVAQAAASVPEKPKRKYVRPEDTIAQPGQLGNPQGSGTNYLGANGLTVGGNPTQIQNTYAPTGDLYGDLGYEPLSDSDKVKQFKTGGHLPSAEFGDYFQSSGQASIGKGVGSAIGGAFFGPIGGAVGGMLGSVAGNLLGGADDANKLKNFQNQTQKNTERTAWSQGANAIHSQNSSFMEEGGWVSHDWQPQLITQFGEHKVSDLLRPDPTMDTLRSGGHLKEYTPPSEEAMFTGRSSFDNGGQTAMGGDLQVHRGKAEPISYNPFLPNGGETVMFKGPSHADGGMPISFGKSGVEVQGGEPAIQLEDGGQDDSLVVYGGMKVSKPIANAIGLKDGAGKKYQTVAANISKFEAKQGKIADKATELANNADENSVFDQLKLNSAKASLIGTKMNYKTAAQQKLDLADAQNEILQLAKQHGVVSDKLAEGKYVKDKNSEMAEFGKMLKKAQNGSIVDYLESQKLPSDKASRKKLATDNGITNYTGTPDQNTQLLTKLKTKTAPVAATTPAADIAAAPDNSAFNIMPINPNNYPLQKGDVGQYQIPQENRFDAGNVQLADQQQYTDFTGGVDSGLAWTNPTIPGGPGARPKKGAAWEDFTKAMTSNISPLFRPTNQMPLDPSQTMGEQYALATNQVEPVKAQTYQPMLQGQPSRVSLQDQINQVDSQARAAIRAAGNNPEAQAMIMSQAIEAKNKIKGDEFRMNQASQEQTYGKNREILNDAQLKNLGILDQQYTRQEEAKSKTKAQAITALNSIADKIAKNKLENRTLGIYENLYKYRFAPQGQAINLNDPTSFYMPPAGTGTTSADAIPQSTSTLAQIEKLIAAGKDAKKLEDTRIEEQRQVKKNGAKIKARNGSIVKSLKTL